jgi:small GTP-binding protein
VTFQESGDRSLPKRKEIKHILKLLLLGDGAVGKTSLILRFIENRFQEEYSMSLGVDFLTKTVRFIDTNNTQRTVSMQVWDIAGQARHVSYSHLYLTGALGALYVFDLTRRETLLNMQERWQSQVLRVSPQCLTILIGNKADLKKKRALTKTQTKRVQEAMRAIDYIETSAKTGENVNEAFQTMTTRILNVTAKKFL